MKRIASAVALRVGVEPLRAKAQNIDNPPIQGKECDPCWCEILQGPTGWMTYTNVVFSPESPMCLGGEISIWPVEDWRRSDAIVYRFECALATTNCPPSTNVAQCPEGNWHEDDWCNPRWITNWWVLSYPGYSGSGSGMAVRFTPTNCGSGSVTFYGKWGHRNFCIGQKTIGGDWHQEWIDGGLVSISTNFTVVNVDIVETETNVCACGVASFTLTNTCGEVTWEVSPSEPGGPYVNGSTVIAGTNCGSWTVIARSTVNTNCFDSATLKVFAVTDLTPEGLSRVGPDELPTYVTCPRTTNAVDRWLRVTATSCPSVAPEESCTNLPSCWQISGGHRTVLTGNCTNRLAVDVDLSQRGVHMVQATAGCSSKVIRIVVPESATLEIRPAGPIANLCDFHPVLSSPRVVEMFVTVVPNVPGLSLYVEMASINPDTPDKGQLYGGPLLYDVSNNRYWGATYRPKHEGVQNICATDPYLQDQTVTFRVKCNEVAFGSNSLTVISGFHYLISQGMYQEAIRFVEDKYGIGALGSPSYDPNLPDYGATSVIGLVSIGPAAFDSENLLASTLIHEQVHANQGIAARYAAGISVLLYNNGNRTTLVCPWSNLELEAYYEEVVNFQRTCLSQADQNLVWDSVQYYIDIKAECGCD